MPDLSEDQPADAYILNSLLQEKGVRLLLHGRDLSQQQAGQNPAGMLSGWSRPHPPGVHFARNLKQLVPKAHQGMVAVAQRGMFAKKNGGEILSRWDDLAVSLAERFPKGEQAHVRGQGEVWSTNL